MASTILSDNGASSGSAGLKSSADSTGVLALQTSTSGGTATTAVTIDTSQNVGIGTTSPSDKLEVTRSSSSNSTGGLSLTNSDSSGYGSSVSWRLKLDGTNISTVGRIYVEAGSATATFMAFQTAIGSTVAERMRIDSSGNLFVGTTNTASGGFEVSPDFNSTLSSAFIVGHASGSASGALYGLFRYGANSIGSITQSGTTAVLYNVTSDQRLKENIIDAPEFGSVIDSIQVRSFDWKTDQTHQRAGFIAQELVTVAPEAVHQPVDTEEMMAVDYSKLVPMLVKEIQSLRTRFATLETKSDTQAETINALTARVVALESKT